MWHSLLDIPMFNVIFTPKVKWYIYICNAHLKWNQWPKINKCTKKYQYLYKHIWNVFVQVPVHFKNIITGIGYFTDRKVLKEINLITLGNNWSNYCVKLLIYTVDTFTL